MRIKYNRVSTIGQTGNRFLNDTDKYDNKLSSIFKGLKSYFSREFASLFAPIC